MGLVGYYGKLWEKSELADVEIVKWNYPCLGSKLDLTGVGYISKSKFFCHALTAFL
jgi:hypothetical protein